MSRHVKFVKHIFPFSSLHSHLPYLLSDTLSHWCSSTSLSRSSTTPFPSQSTHSALATESPTCVDPGTTMPLTLITPSPIQLMPTPSTLLDQAQNPPNSASNPLPTPVSNPGPVPPNPLTHLTRNHRPTHQSCKPRPLQNKPKLPSSLHPLTFHLICPLTQIHMSL